jgi:HTH-type transcriptional regulator/antitoxin HigA
MPSVSTTYINLVKKFALRPLRSEREVDQAAKIADRLAVKKTLTTAERDYLDVLAQLIERYEDEFHEIDPLPDREILRFLISESGRSQLEVSRQSGIANSTLSSVLSGKRELTRHQVETLSAYFHVAPGVFLVSDGAAVS